MAQKHTPASHAFPTICPVADRCEVECNAIETWAARDGDEVLGIAAGVLLALPIWSVIGAAWWWLL